MKATKKYNILSSKYSNRIKYMTSNKMNITQLIEDIPWKMAGMKGSTKELNQKVKLYAILNFKIVHQKIID